MLPLSLPPPRDLLPADPLKNAPRAEFLTASFSPDLTVSSSRARSVDVLKEYLLPAVL